MRKLAILFSLIFSLAGALSTAYAQDETVDGAALISAELPEGVTLETATQAELSAAIEAVVDSGASSSAVAAAVSAATSTGTITSTQASAVAITAAVEASVAPPPAAQTSSSTLDPADASEVIAAIIESGNLSFAEATAALSTTIDLVTVVSNDVDLAVNAIGSAINEFTNQFIASEGGTTLANTVVELVNDLQDEDLTDGVVDVIAEDLDTNLNCTVSNSVPVCTAS